MTLVETKHTTHDDKQYPFVDDPLPHKNPKNPWFSCNTLQNPYSNFWP